MITFGKGNRRPEPDKATAVRLSICNLRLWASLLLAGAVAGLGLSLALVLPPALNAAATSPPQTQTTTVRCEPDLLIAAMGASASVAIYVQDVVDLYGLDVRMQFDPAYAQVVDADPGVSGVQIQPLSGFVSSDFVVRRSADNTTGVIHYAVTQVAPSPPASGSGAVARIELRGVQPGVIAVPFTQIELARNDGSIIPATTQACTWQFSQPRLRYLPLVTIR